MRRFDGQTAHPSSDNRKRPRQAVEVSAGEPVTRQAQPASSTVVALVESTVPVVALKVGSPCVVLATEP